MLVTYAQPVAIVKTSPRYTTACFYTVLLFMGLLGVIVYCGRSPRLRQIVAVTPFNSEPPHQFEQVFQHSAAFVTVLQTYYVKISIQIYLYIIYLYKQFINQNNSFHWIYMNVLITTPQFLGSLSICRLFRVIFKKAGPIFTGRSVAYSY